MTDEKSANMLIGGNGNLQFEGETARVNFMFLSNGVKESIEPGELEEMVDR